LSEATLALGSRVASALLGLDALYRKESGDEDGLVVVNLDPAGLAAEAFSSYDDARRGFEELRSDAASLPEDDRRRYYDDLCHSTLAFVRWRASGLPFADQLRDFLHVSAEPASEGQIDALRSEMRGLLDGLGYGGDLVAQCAAWEERHRVPPAAVPEVLRELLDEAWDRTERLLLAIPAPKADGMRVTGVTGAPFNARCDYKNRSIELNLDPVLTRPGLKHLAVHEGYPGHYVQFKLRETLARAGKATADVLLSVVNSASSSVFEGIGDTGTLFLDWMETDDDRLQALMNRYRAGIGTGAAWRLHALGWPEDRVGDWLRGLSLVGGEGWVANRVRFVADPARAVLIWSYWWGEPVVRAAWERVTPERRPEFLLYLHGRMHSNASVGLFA
jgi:hypothetical protein